MMRIAVDTTRCIGAGRCVLTTPDVFDSGSDGLARVLVQELDESRAAAVREVVRLCPVGAIRLEQASDIDSRRNAMQPCVDLLVSLGADTVKHPGGTLLTHLLRCVDMLEEWGASRQLREAGLLHALFAPDGSPDPMYSMLALSERPRVAELIGVPGEHLVYLYGACDREYTYPRLMDSSEQWRDRFTNEIRTPTQSELRDLMEITAANECDICSHNPRFRAEHGAELFELFTRTRPLLSDAAWARCQQVLG
jgi:ferredoxin